MRRKVIIWFLTLATTAFALPFATCATSSIQGVIQAFKPCDVFNCQNPNYFDPCMFINCVRPYTYSQTTSTTNTQ